MEEAFAYHREEGCPGRGGWRILQQPWFNTESLGKALRQKNLDHSGGNEKSDSNNVVFLESWWVKDASLGE